MRRHHERSTRFRSHRHRRRHRGQQRGSGMTANELKAVIFAYPSFASDMASIV